MTNLITESGGEMCAMENSPVIESTSHNNDTEAELVSHINYVRKCIKHGELLDPSNFKGENFGMKIKENDSFHLVDDHLRLQVEHSYAQRDRFQRQSKNTSGGKNYPCQVEPEITNNQSPTVAPTRMTILRRWVGVARTGSVTAEQNWPKLKVNEVNLPREAEKEGGNSPHQISQEIAKSLNEMENMPLYERLQVGQGSQIIILDCDMSPRLGSSKFRRRTHAKKRVIDDQPVACSSKTAESTTILRDEFNQVKILGNTQASHLTSLNSKNRDVLFAQMDTSRVANNDALIGDNKSNAMSDGRVASPSSHRAARSAAGPIILRNESNQVKILRGIKESLHNMERFRLTSSDSDDTDYNPTTSIFDREERRSVDQSSSYKTRETGSKKKVLKKRRENPSPSGDSDISEDEEVPEVLNDGKKTVRQSKSNKKLDDNSHTSNNRVNISRVSNNERNTVVSSTRSSDDVMSISNSSSSDSDSLSDDEVAGPSSHRVARSAISDSQSEDGLTSSESKRPSSWIERREVNREKRKGSRLLTRNFSRWEQRMMIDYLIKKRFISDAKGNLVWQQMLKDGFLQHRTYQSLNNHFRKYILPHIHRFPMSSKCLRKFQRLQ